MDDVVEPRHSTPDLESPPGLANVSDVSLLELLRSKEPRIADSVRRLMADGRHRHDVLLGWSSQPANLQPCESTTAERDGDQP